MNTSLVLRMALVVSQCRLAPPPDEDSVASALKECKDFGVAKRLHAQLAATGQDRSTELGSLLIDMYNRLGITGQAKVVFDRLDDRSTSSWNRMILGYARKGLFQEAIELFRRMDQEGKAVDAYTLSNILGVFTKLRDLEQGRMVHGRVLDMGLCSNIVLATGLINFYGKCGLVDEALDVFQGSVEASASVGCWSALAGAYNDVGDFQGAIHLYSLMKLEGVKANKLTFMVVLNACASNGASSLRHGREIHACLAAEGLDQDVVVGANVVNMYGKCSSSGEARKAFEAIPDKSVVCWNAMVAAYAQNGESEQAFVLFRTMLLEGDVVPDRFTLSTMVGAVESMADARLVSSLARDSGLTSDRFLGNSLVTMFGRQQCMDGAREAFEAIVAKDVVSWTALVDACVRCQRSRDSLQLYHQMNLVGVKPNNVTFASVLDACTDLGDLPQGKRIHAALSSSSLSMGDQFLATSLLNMYGRCGSLDMARRIFDDMRCRDVVAWTSMVACYASNYRGSEALELFREMQLEGVIPTIVSYNVMLSACSPACLVDEAAVYFSSMTVDHGMVPSVEHCLCLVDLLARSGKLREAEEFIDKMPMKPGEAAWNVLLAACGTSADVRGFNQKA